jgi:hypothetical protein
MRSEMQGINQVLDNVTKLIDIMVKLIIKNSLASEK